MNDEHFNTAIAALANRFRGIEIEAKKREHRAMLIIPIFILGLLIASAILVLLCLA